MRAGRAEKSGCVRGHPQTVGPLHDTMLLAPCSSADKLINYWRANRRRPRQIIDDPVKARCQTHALSTISPVHIRGSKVTRAKLPVKCTNLDLIASGGIWMSGHEYRVDSGRGILGPAQGSEAGGDGFIPSRRTLEWGSAHRAQAIHLDR